MLAGTVLVMFDAFSGTSGSLVEAIFVIPLPLNELTPAVWLIFKGFENRSTLTGSPERAGERRAIKLEVS